jgi:hypothetical protein
MSYFRKAEAEFTMFNDARSKQQEKARPQSIFGQYAVTSKTPFDLDKLAKSYRFKDMGWSTPEAYLGIMIAAAEADGHVEPEEEAEILTRVRRARTLRYLKPEDLVAAEGNARQYFAERPQTALDEACQTLPAELCLPVFAHCVDIMLSDGELVDVEARWLEDLVPKLDIDQDSAKRILEVLLLKAKY